MQICFSKKQARGDINKEKLPEMTDYLYKNTVGERRYSLQKCQLRFISTSTFLEKVARELGNLSI